MELSILKEENKKLKQIIIILNKYYGHFHLTGKAVLDMSDEAETMTYREMHSLQILLENTIKGVENYED